MNYTIIIFSEMGRHAIACDAIVLDAVLASLFRNRQISGIYVVDQDGKNVLSLDKDYLALFYDERITE